MEGGGGGSHPKMLPSETHPPVRPRVCALHLPIDVGRQTPQISNLFLPSGLRKTPPRECRTRNASWQFLLDSLHVFARINGHKISPLPLFFTTSEITSGVLSESGALLRGVPEASLVASI